jgi:hypothetical protein
LPAFADFFEALGGVVEVVVAFLAVTFVAGFATIFLADTFTADFFTGTEFFFAAEAFFATGLAIAFLTGFPAMAFLAVDLLAGAFLAVDLLAGAFLAGVGFVIATYASFNTNL